MRRLGPALLVALLLLGACAGIEPAPVPVADDKPGPGLFTGADGELVITPR